MIWFLYHVFAILRGRRYQWPRQPPIPAGYAGVSCGLRTWRESKAMFKHGWIPWSVQRTTDGAISRLFLADNTPGMIDRLEEEEMRDIGLS